MADIDLGVTLYDLNKKAMAQKKPLDPIEFNSVTKKMVCSMVDSGTKYWMLLCHERRDYTVFIILTEEGTLQEIRPTLSNRGQIISIDETEGGSFEIWIRDLDTKENFLYFLFDCTYAIIKA